MTRDEGWLDWTVSELVRRCPDAMPVLHRRGIDLCCGGWLTLRQAAEQTGVAPETLLAELVACGLGGQVAQP